MALRKKKKTVLDRRLREIDHEMARLNSEVKAVSRSGVLREFNTGSKLQSADLQQASQNQPSVSAQEGLDTVADTGSEGAEKSTMDSIIGKPIPESEDKVRQQQGHFDRGVKHRHVREKFASYFMTGHFQDLRPLRQDSRIIRNKAIMMVILVILAAIWVFYFLG